MNLMKLWLSLAVAVAAFTLSAGSSFAQNNYAVVPLTARDNVGTVDKSCTFGAHVDATYCLDTLTVNTGLLIETEQPPPPPAEVFDVRFTSIYGIADCFGQGMDINLLPVGVADTFKLVIQSQAFPVTISWGEAAAWIATDWANLTMKDGFGGVFVNVNMKTDTSVTITQSLITTVFIVGTSNAGGTLNVDKEGDLIPQKFELQQNYPNPFNPSTTVKFAIEKTAFADVAVYNVIGQKVKTLAAEVLNPGYYSATWNGTDESGQSVTSGVYFVRMVATGEGTAFSDLRKLLLVK
jgi:hypothetical protein